MQRDFHHHHHFPQKRLSVCLNRTSFIHTYSKLHTDINPYIHSQISIMHITKQTYKKYHGNIIIILCTVGRKVL